MRHLKAKAKYHIHHGTKLVTKLFEASGLPHGYSVTIAWFAERLVLASLALATLSFVAGVIFVTRLAEPIGNSGVYDAAAQRARFAEQGIKVFSQQVIDTASPVFAGLVKAYRNDAAMGSRELALRKDKLQKYLESKNSPFAEDAETIESFAVSKNMKLMVAISFVESTFGKHCYYYNCSGIGGTPPHLRKYDSYAEWVRDFDSLLERRYKGLAPEEFIGLYVQPGSPNWLYGVEQVLQELEAEGLT